MNKSSLHQFIITVIILFVYKTVSHGQAMTAPYWMNDNNYLTDKYLINPAFAGYQYYPKVFVGAQRMDVQHPDAPSVHIAGFHSRLGIMQNYFREHLSDHYAERNSIGALLFTDKNGPYHITGIKLDYVYSVPLDRFQFNILSFGLGGILLSKSFRLDKNISSWINDPFIVANVGNKITIPDFNAGILFSRHEKFYAGFSVSQIMQNLYHVKLNFTMPPVYRNYYFLTGYRFETNLLDIEPSVAVGRNLAPKNHSNYGNFIDINLELFLKPIVFTQSVRINGYITSSLLYRANKLEMGARAEWLSLSRTNAHITSVALMISYTFLPAKFLKQDK